MNVKINLILFFLFNSIIVLSQNVEINGQALAKDGKPLKSALINLSNDEYFYNQLADSLGRYKLFLEKGQYIVKVYYNDNVVYKDSLWVSENSILQPFVTDYFENILDEIKVIAKKKPLLSRKGDRLIFNVDQSINAEGKNILDLLKITPGLQVRNNQITVIGKNAVSVMIDEQELSFSEEDLSEYLASMPSELVQKIEVINNPSAKYDSEGNSGLINIVLRKQVRDGFKGSIGASYLQSKYSTGNYNASLNYKKNNFTLNTNFNYVNGGIGPYQEYTLNYPEFKWFEENKSRVFQDNFSGYLNVGYKTSNDTKLNFNYTSNVSSATRKGNNTSFIRNNISMDLDSIIRTPSYVEKNKELHSLGFSYDQKLDSLGKKIFFDVNYLYYDSEIDNTSASEIFDGIGNQLSGRGVRFKNLSKQYINLVTSKVDYEIPLTWVNLSIGAKVAFINTRSKVDYSNLSVNHQVSDYNDKFEYNENTQAAYVSLQKNFSESFNAQIGLRGEATQTKGLSRSLNRKKVNDYFKLFPSLYLTYLIDDDNIVSLNYNKRVDRPTYGDLNPFKFYSTPFNYSEGNPFLQPYFTHNVELSYIHKNWYNALYFSYINNGIDQITIVSPSETIQRLMPYNFYKQNNVGLIENYTFNYWRWWESNNTALLFYTETNNDKLAEANIPNISRWSWSFNSVNSFIINRKETIKAELSFLYHAKSIANSYIISSYYQFDAGIRFSLIENKLNLSITAEDIFRTNKSKFYQTVNGVSQKNYDYQDIQKLKFSLVYQFGKFKKAQLEQEKMEEEIDKSSSSEETDRIK